MKIFKSNEGYTMTEILVSLLIITIIAVSVIAINGHALNLYKYGIMQAKEINDLSSSADGSYTEELQETVTKTSRFDLDYIMKIDSSNTTYSTYLDPEDNYTYRGAGMYMRYIVEKFETNEEDAGLFPCYVERYISYD